MGEFFSVACAAVWGLAVVLFRRSGETLPAFELNLFKNALGVALMVPTVLLLEGPALPRFSVAEWWIVVVSGVIGIAIADTWYLRALNLIGASRTGIVATLFSPFVIVLSMLFLAEAMRPVQYLGFVLVICGITLVTWRQDRRDVSLRALRLGVALGAGAVFLMAAGVVMVKPVLEGEHFFWIVALRLAAGTLGMLMFLSAMRGWRGLVANFRRPQPWPTVVLASVLGSYVSMMLWLAGYRLTSASVASVLNETQAAFITLFAFLVLGEPLSLRRICGIVLAFCGVAVILVV